MSKDAVKTPSELTITEPTSTSSNIKRFGKQVVKILIGMEIFFIFLYIVNIYFEKKLVDPILYHQQVYHFFLSTSTINSTIIISVPIMITAVGACFNERAGVINIGLEGIMLMSAWTAIYLTLETHNPWIGVLGAILIGAFLGFLHGLFTITLKAEQIVTGVAINLLATGMVKLLSILVWQTQYSPLIAYNDTPQRFNFFDIPILGKIIEVLSISKYADPNNSGNIQYYIPDVVKSINNLSWLIIIVILLVPLSHILLFKTSIGLRLRVVGEHPQAAATAGISVIKYQYFAVIISGILAGLGGAVLGLADARQFKDGMVGGRGFLALAAMIFGKWTVIGAVLASVFFGYFVKLGISAGISIDNFSVPTPFFQMVPYIATILILSGYIGRATPPKHIGKPYDPSEST